MSDSTEDVHKTDLLKTYPPPAKVKEVAHVNSFQEYQRLYDLSVKEPDTFWGDIADQFYWKSRHTGPFFNYNFDVKKGPIFIKWMEGATTNISYNVLDRNIEKGLGDKIAFYWEGNNPSDDGKITYSELLERVCQFANVLKDLGVKKGDRVAIYMPMVVELEIAMLACARIGAVHSIVFAGFSAESLSDRIIDANCCAIVTSDGVWRGSKLLNLKAIVDKALDICKEKGQPLKHCIVYCHLTHHEANNGPHSNGDVKEMDGVACRPTKKIQYDWVTDRDFWWHDLMKSASKTCEPEWMDAEDPLFMLYTSGSTGKPKGVLHTIGGYMLYAATTFKYVFDYHPEDIYWCTADVGWITGHTYVCYGPLSNGATGIIFEGVPFYPDAGRLWEVVAKYKVTKFYTAPTAIRSLMKYGDEFVTKHDRSSLKILGTVGEPINPEAWVWYHQVVGAGQCSIVDTFWQTETGGHVITPLPGAHETKPGCAAFPFFGIVPAILSDEGNEITGAGEGYLFPGLSHDFGKSTFYGYDFLTALYDLPVSMCFLINQQSLTSIILKGVRWDWVLSPDLFNLVDELNIMEGISIGGVNLKHQVFRKPWPGIMRTVFGNHERFETTYFKKFPGFYCTGDGARRDEDGCLWITGRIDDMVNVSGHLLSTAEVESALIEHDSVAEAASVSHPHPIKGECIYCFVSLKEGRVFSDALSKELVNMVRSKIGPFAQPDFIQNAPALPKTRSGKIMRRILRKIAINDKDLGDTSTLADESVIDMLFKLRPKNA